MSESHPGFRFEDNTAQTVGSGHPPRKGGRWIAQCVRVHPTFVAHFGISWLQVVHQLD